MGWGLGWRLELGLGLRLGLDLRMGEMTTQSAFLRVLLRGLGLGLGVGVGVEVGVGVGVGVGRLGVCVYLFIARAVAGNFGRVDPLAAAGEKLTQRSPRAQCTAVCPAPSDARLRAPPAGNLRS